MKITYVNFWPRLMAHNIDMVLLLPVYYFFGWVIPSNPVLLTTCLTFTLIYEITFITSNWRATPGKKTMGIEVVDLNGDGLTTWRSILRTVTKALTFPVLLIGGMFALTALKKQFLHDRIARSLVIFSAKF